MNFKKNKRFLSATLTALVTLTSMNVFATINRPLDVKQVFKNLSVEERLQIISLNNNLNSKLNIPQDINLEDDAEISIIVQFNEEPAKIQEIKAKNKGQAIKLSEAEDKVNQSHKKFKEHVKKSKSSEKINLKNEYKRAFNGVAMTLPANAVKEIITSAEVHSVWLDKKVQLEPSVEMQISTETPSITPLMPNSIPFIGVDKLHAEDITGQGVRVGVIDTGIDYNHPDLKDVYKGGYDFVDNDNDPMEATYDEWKESGEPEYSPYGSPYYTSHGTHVSGTIAGQADNNSEYAVKGVAPDIDLYVYRALGEYGMGETSGIIAAIEKSLEDNLDVINLSLGAGINDPMYPTSIAINNVVMQGVTAAVSAGNSGSNLYTLGSPGTAPLAVTVGASSVSVEIPTFDCSVNGDTFNTRLMARGVNDKLEDLNGESLNIVDAGLGYLEDFEGKDFTGKIALIERGQLAFVEKIKNAKDAGAKAVLIWNNVEGDIEYYHGESKEAIIALTTTQEIGEKIKANLTENTQITFNGIGSLMSEGDKLAEFSSRGPVSKNFDIKPEVTGPGVDVFSTVPSYITNKEDSADYSFAYQRQSGTSMSSPHIAGIMALILQQNPEYTPADVKAALMNSSVDLNGDYSVYEVGAGRVDAYNSVHSKVDIKVLDKAVSIDMTTGEEIEIEDITGAISFGYHSKIKNSSIIDSRNLEISNRSDVDKEFRVEIEYVSSELPNASDCEENGVVLSVDEIINVKANSKVEISPQIEVPENAEEGFYEGYIHLINTADNTEDYQIPFAIMTAERGIEMSTQRKAFASRVDRPNPHMLLPATILKLKVGNVMESLDILLKDDKTGDYIGYLGSFDPDMLDPTVEYNIPFVFMSGVYLPLTGDEENPIGEEWVMAEEGAYEIELVGYDKDGEMYTASDYVFIDNTVPEVTMDENQDFGIYEIKYNENDENGVTWFNGKTYDSNIDLMKSKGIKTGKSNLTGKTVPLDQGLTTIVGYQDSPFPTHYFIPEAEGSFKFGVSPEELEGGKYQQFGFYAYDYATAGDLFTVKNYYLIKEGERYSVLKSDKTKLYKDEEVTITLTMENADDLIGGKFDVGFWDNYKFVEAKLNSEFEKYAQDNNMSTEIEIGDVVEGSWQNIITLSAFLDGDISEGIDGDIPVIDVTFKLVDDQYYGGEPYMNLISSQYYGVNEEVSKKIPAFSDAHIRVVPSTSTVYGKVSAEAFFNEEGWIEKDLLTSGIEITAVSSTGESFQGKLVTSVGDYEITNLPPQKEPYRINIQVPGHFETNDSAILSEELDGELIGNLVRVNPGMTAAGDVNGDNVIDVQDAFLMANQMNKPGARPRRFDINFDGEINSSDMEYIVKNYNKINKNVENAPTPKEKHGGKTLEDILEEQGMSTLNYKKYQSDLVKLDYKARINYFNQDDNNTILNKYKKVFNKLKDIMHSTNK